MSNFDRNLPKAVETRPKTSNPMRNLPSIFVSTLEYNSLKSTSNLLININFNLTSLLSGVARKLCQNRLKETMKATKTYTDRNKKQI